MKRPGLTISLIIEAESANYGEGFGNITTLKKITRSDGLMYTYISRQALRYSLINQLNWDN
ncbi:MAG: type I-B CRISPR-associated protein Cas7/Cst2/DevR, partial [Bacillota bacterium]